MVRSVAEYPMARGNDGKGKALQSDFCLSILKKSARDDKVRRSAPQRM
jgi:hypothetical protein